MFDRGRDHSYPHIHSYQPTFGDVVCSLWRCLLVSVVAFDLGGGISSLYLC